MNRGQFSSTHAADTTVQVVTDTVTKIHQPIGSHLQNFVAGQPQTTQVQYLHNNWTAHPAKWHHKLSIKMLPVPMIFGTFSPSGIQPITNSSMAWSGQTTNNTAIVSDSAPLIADLWPWWNGMKLWQRQCQTQNEASILPTISNTFHRQALLTLPPL